MATAQAANGLDLLVAAELIRFGSEVITTSSRCSACSLPLA